MDRKGRGVMIWYQRCVLGLALLSLVACDNAATGPSDPAALARLDGTLFISQPQLPDAQMEALFQGAVLRDDAGCLRLQPPSHATVVWPYGSHLVEKEGEHWVQAASGQTMGLVGGIFRFGGGVVPALNEGMGFTAAQIRTAHSRCPGRFWLVGEVLTP